jgi:hypothetical protein
MSSNVMAKATAMMNMSAKATASALVLATLSGFVVACGGHAPPAIPPGQALNPPGAHPREPSAPPGSGAPSSPNADADESAGSGN